MEPWSAGIPRLYEATVSAPGETVSLQIGFRSLTIEDAQFKVNGRRILLRGVIRHGTVRDRDPSRPIRYEGDWSSPYVDVYSRMYASQAETALVGQGVEPPLEDPALDARRRAMPFVVREYVHAMGNGPGGMSEYQELYERYRRLMGGFVWEWLEYGISVPSPGGGEHFAYGGDFGELIHDGNFVTDGLVDANRTPRPRLLDFKRVVAPAADRG